MRSQHSLTTEPVSCVTWSKCRCPYKPPAWLLAFLLWLCSLLPSRFIVGALLRRCTEDCSTLLHSWISVRERCPLWRRKVNIDTYVDYLFRLVVIRLLICHSHSLKRQLIQFNIPSTWLN